MTNTALNNVKDRFTVWSNMDLNLDDWREYLLSENPDSTEDEMYEMMYDTNNDYLGDERMNLNIQLPRSIIIIADLGLWNGRRSGYKIIKSGNIKDCLYSGGDYSEWYVDGDGEFCCKSIHHDGVNYYTYRTFRSGATETQIDRLLDLIYSGEADWDDINKVTKGIGRDVCKVYGWKLSELKKNRKDGSL